ncbi:hypothetical protein DFH06DRAFT_574444 [Mycena polygramma]|nr:hypothetical protein DFH06DRAFT_574444 [Mycena polygramma]
MSQRCPNCEAPSQTLALLDLPAASPNLTHLLTSNEPPLETEVPSIQNVIGHGQDRITLLHAQISSLEAQIHDLNNALLQFQNQRDEIAESVRQHQSVLSPVRRVPAELLCEIFLATSPSEDANNPPWYLGHICRSWRRYALSYPALWLSIAISSSPLDVSRMISILGAQLERSAYAPLDIHWRCVDNRDFDQRLLELIIPHSRRWRSLYFHGHVNVGWLQDVNGRLDRLQKVAVEPVDTTKIIFPDVFSTARNLREVILTDESLVDSPTIVIPWTQITRYHGTYSSERQLEILRAAAATLLDCAIGFTGDDFDNDSLRIVTLPTLRRLSSQYVGVLPHLAAPVLEELRLILGHEPMSLAAPFISRTSCTLTRLALTECRIDDVIPVLRTLSSLTSLLIELEYGSDTTADWTTAMSISGAASDMCPRLTSLDLGCELATQVSWDLFFSMARSRFEILSSCHSRLLCLRLFCVGVLPPSDQMLADMEMLRDEGFDAAFIDYNNVYKGPF